MEQEHYNAESQTGQEPLPQIQLDLDLAGNKFIDDNPDNGNQNARKDIVGKMNSQIDSGKCDQEAKNRRDDICPWPLNLHGQIAPEASAPLSVTAGK